MSEQQLELSLGSAVAQAARPKPCWKAWKIGDRVRVLESGLTGSINALPPKKYPFWRATVNFDHPDNEGHGCCFCTQDEMERLPVEI